MFKRKYVKISSEKVIQKIEDFLQKNGWDGRLESNELYAFRYALGNMKINIKNPFIIRRIGLNDIIHTFNSSRYIIFSENDKYGLKNDDTILDICCELDKRIIFLEFSNSGKYVEQIGIYLPSKKDTMFNINELVDCQKNFLTCDYLIEVDYLLENANDKISFIDYLVNYNKDFIKYHVQDATIIKTNDLNYEKEFFTFTNLNIEGSTITFHYVP